MNKDDKGGRENIKRRKVVGLYKRKREREREREKKKKRKKKKCR